MDVVWICIVVIFKSLILIYMFFVHLMVPVVDCFLLFLSSFFSVGRDITFLFGPLHFEEAATKTGDHTISPYSLR